MAFGLESDLMCGTWSRQLSSEATKQWFTQMLETRFNIQRAFRSVLQFLFFFHPWGSFPLVNPKDSSCWIVCRSFPFFFTRRCGVCSIFDSSSIPNFYRPLLHWQCHVTVAFLPVGRTARAPGPTFISIIVLVSHFCPLSEG